MTAPAYYPCYIPPAGHTQPSYVTDDLHYRMRPNVDSVLSRDYSQYGPLSWSWTDFTRQTRHRTPSCSGRDNYGLRASPQPQPVYNKYLTSDLTSDPTSDLQSGPGKAHNKNSTPYFLKSRLPMYGTKDTRKYEDLPGAISSSSNTAFPFRKYKTNFIPYAPYKSLHDTAKYTPNPDWLLYRPWGYKFRKARYVYVPEDENSSKSIEIERVMRETGLRELVKGVYSSSYGESVNTKTMTYEADQEKMVKKD